MAAASTGSTFARRERTELGLGVQREDLRGLREGSNGTKTNTISMNDESRWIGAIKNWRLGEENGRHKKEVVAGRIWSAL